MRLEREERNAQVTEAIRTLGRVLGGAERGNAWEKEREEGAGRPTGQISVRGRDH